MCRFTLYMSCEQTSMAFGGSGKASPTISFGSSNPASTASRTLVDLLLACILKGNIIKMGISQQMPELTLTQYYVFDDTTSLLPVSSLLVGFFARGASGIWITVQSDRCTACAWSGGARHFKCGVNDPATECRNTTRSGQQQHQPNARQILLHVLNTGSGG